MVKIEGEKIRSLDVEKTRRLEGGGRKDRRLEVEKMEDGKGEKVSPPH